jgi:hypothetical protein
VVVLYHFRSLTTMMELWTTLVWWCKFYLSDLTWTVCVNKGKVNLMIIRWIDELGLLAKILLATSELGPITMIAYP